MDELHTDVVTEETRAPAAAESSRPPWQALDQLAAAASRLAEDRERTADD